MKILQVGMFQVGRLNRDWAAGRGPSHPVHAVCELTRYGHELAVYDSGATPARGRLAFQRALLRDRPRCDVLLAQNLLEINLVAMLRAAGLFRTPIVAFVHSVGWRSVQKISAHGVDALLTLSADAAAKLQAAGVARSRIVPFDYGADLDFCAPAGAIGRTVLSIGVSGRDFATLCAAARRIDAEVVIVGKVPAQLRADPGARVRILSDGNYELGFEQIRELYRDSRVVAVIHHGTPHPYGLNALVEAMAMARPVVLTAGAGIDIDPQALGFGLRVPAHDPPALAQALARYLDDESLARRSGAAARLCAEARYSSKIMAQRLDEVVRRVGRAA